jgi:hypothetical protein
VVLLFGLPTAADQNKRLEAIEQRMKEVFKLDTILFEDFQVDRTELSLSTECLPAAARSSAFSIVVQIRLMEDRMLSFNSVQFARGIEERLSKRQDGTSDTWPRCFLARTPGARMNFSLCLVGSMETGQCATQSTSGWDYQQLLELLCGNEREPESNEQLRRIDIIETSVAKRSTALTNNE